MVAKSEVMIGVVLEWLESAYQLPVLRGIRHAARELGMRVVAVVSALPDGAPAWLSRELFAEAGFSGLILLPHHDPRWPEFVRGLKETPLVAVATELAGASTVGVDNASGLGELLRHLAHQHGCRRVAYVSGPEGDVDARDRLEALRDAVDKYGLELDPAWVVAGDYQVGSGRRAVHTLLDDRGHGITEIDVILAGNDAMARGVVDELTGRGIRVPWQVAVVGFDDEAMAQLAPVPLTTVHQPLHGLGRRALQELLGRMEGAPIEHTVLPTGLVVRRSCGCLEGMGRLDLSVEDQRRRGGRGFEVTVHERREATLAEIRRTTRERVVGLQPGWEARLFSTVVDELKGRGPSAFRVEIEDLLDRTLEHRGDPAVFHDVVSILWRSLVPCAMADPGLRTTLEGLLDGARLAIARAKQREQASDLEAHEGIAGGVVDVCVELAATTTLDEVVEILRARLGQLGVRRLVLGVYPKDGSRDALDRILLFDAGAVTAERVRVKASELSSSILPPGTPGDALLMPLYAHGAVFGAVGMVVQPVNPFVCLRIRAALGAVLDRLLGSG